MNQFKKCTLVLNFYYITPINCVRSTDIPVVVFFDFTCGNFFFLMFYLIFCVLVVIICKNMSITFIFCPPHPLFFFFTIHGSWNRLFVKFKVG